MCVRRGADGLRRPGRPEDRRHGLPHPRREAARRGALLLIPGGPGGSSLDDPSGKGQKLPQEVRDSYDLIGFAPRGLAPSTAVSCGLEHGDLALSKLRPWPAADGSVTGNMATARRMAEACARNGGELIRHISTVDEARPDRDVRGPKEPSRRGSYV